MTSWAMFCLLDMVYWTLVAKSPAGIYRGHGRRKEFFQGVGQ